MKRIWIYFTLLLQTLFYAGPSSPGLFAQAQIPALSPFQKLLEIFDIPADASTPEIILRTQKLWYQAGKERWEFDDRHESLREQVWPLFEEMGLIGEIKPKGTRYRYALVHGALLSRMVLRAEYLAKLHKEGVEFDKIVFLTGARPLQESEREKTGVETEKEMAEWVYLRSELPKEIPVLFVDAPMKRGKNGALARPQTIDTVKGWLETEPERGSCLAVSNQPYVSYQDSILRSYLPEGFSLETVGPEVTGHFPVSIVLDSIAKELYWNNSH